MRLQPVGRRKQISYRIVIAEKSAPIKGKHVAVLGYYDPRRPLEELKLDVPLARYWLSVGAQPTETVKHLLIKKGHLDQGGNQLEVQGTASDKLLQTFMQFLRHRYPDRSRDGKWLVKFASRLTEYTDDFFDAESQDQRETVQQQMGEWIDRFVVDSSESANNQKERDSARAVRKAFSDLEQESSARERGA